MGLLLIFFHSASITFKIKKIEKIHTKSFKILFKKSISLAFLVTLSWGLKIEHFYWKLTAFCITSEPTMSKMLGNFFVLFWLFLNFKNFMVSAGIKEKKQVWLIKRQIFQTFLHGGLWSYTKFSSFPIEMFNLKPYW